MHGNITTQRANNLHIVVSPKVQPVRTNKESNRQVMSIMESELLNSYRLPSLLADASSVTTQSTDGNWSQYHQQLAWYTPIQDWNRKCCWPPTLTNTCCEELVTLCFCTFIWIETKQCSYGKNKKTTTKQTKTKLKTNKKQNKRDTCA